MVVLTDNGVKVSSDGGRSWTLQENGLPNNRRASEHNQIAVSPKNNRHIFFAFNFWEGGQPKNGLYYTEDFGRNWVALVNQNGWARPPFVVLSSQSAIVGGSNSFDYDLYYSNGGCQFRRRPVFRWREFLRFGTWTNINTDHCDAADLAFSKDGKTPILLVSDGGVHKTTDGGTNWTMTGAGASGYNALQITEVIGQKTSDDGLADLYFATQDNHIWASPDHGSSWPNSICCEGFYLTVPRESLPPSETTHTGKSCAPCGNYKSGPLLTSISSWNNPPDGISSPALISPGRYIQAEYDSESNLWKMAKSMDTGAHWSSTVNINKEIRSMPSVSGSPSDPVVYIAVCNPGTTNGAPNIGLRRITGLLGPTYIQSEVTGFGNIGIFPTMFAWYEVFGVKPTDPTFIIIPDIANDVVQKSTDGGISWNPDHNLTNLVTNSGEFKFHWDQFSQITSFGFDPECEGHIMVGTEQAGIFQTFDNGNTWEKLPGSEHIPRVSSFFFSKKGFVVIASYGRGLWSYRYKCPAPPIFVPPPIYEFKAPVLWFKGLITPLTDIVLPDSCPPCGFFLLRNGEIVDILVDSLSNRVTEIIIDKGEIKGYSLDGKELQIPVKVSIGKAGSGIISTNKKLAAMLGKKGKVKGVYLTGTLFNGLILHTTDIDPADLPKRKESIPAIWVLNDLSDIGIPAKEGKDIIIAGSGFDPQFPIEVIIDGETVKLEQQPKFGKRGVFRLSIPPVFGIGSHPILIRQKTAKGIIEARRVIRITVQDFPREDENK
jgi:hypothetical protein